MEETIMLKLDFMNKNYSLEEVVDALTDGSIDNFSGDRDFLNFLISYSLGKYLEGTEANKFTAYANCDGLLNLMQLDEYGYFGKPLYKIYEICGKDKIKFMRVCDAIGRYQVTSMLDKNTIDTNLLIKHPVDFIDETIVLSDGTIPVFVPEGSGVHRYELSFVQRQEYAHELERSLRHRINESIKDNGDETVILDELLSYKEKERLEKEKIERKKVPDDYIIVPDNLYYGKSTIDVSGGILGLNMTEVSWFENTNIKVLNNRIFRSIPTGDYFLVDNDGKIYIPEKVISNGSISIGPNSIVRKIEIICVPKLFELVISRLNEDPVSYETQILELNGMLELMQNQNGIAVSELKKYQGIIRAMYEQLFGEIFKTGPDNNISEGGKAFN